MLPLPHTGPPRARGFTLIELMITVAIVAVLASLAYPSFMASVRKSRRAEAVEMMTTIQQAQERWRANNPAYTTNLATGGLRVLNSATATSSIATARGYYTVTVTVPSGDDAASQYTITAQVPAGGSQEADTQCTAMSLRMSGGKLSYDSTSGERCWAK